MPKENAINAFSTSSEVAKKNNVLIAPLNWGLGHATRCIPIIRFLLKNNYTPIIASDGEALKFLKKEFPSLFFIELPSYGIQYSKKSWMLKWRLSLSFFSIRKAVAEEHIQIKKISKEFNLVGIISDNRFGVYHSIIPSVYITHQISVLSGFTTFFTSFFHQKIISKFDECWIPDLLDELNLSGKLSATSGLKIPFKFIGNLSRLQDLKDSKKHDVLLLLSGPEPQRTILENLLLLEFDKYQGKVFMVRGIVQDKIEYSSMGRIEVVNYLTSKELERIVNNSELVVSRSGYSTIMDLAKLHKKAFFIPTPGQSEQEYLAQNLEQKKIAPFCKQEQFKISMISKTDEYSGFIDEYSSKLELQLLNVFKKN